MSWVGTRPIGQRTLCHFQKGKTCPDWPSCSKVRSIFPVECKQCGYTFRISGGRQAHRPTAPLDDDDGLGDGCHGLGPGQSDRGHSAISKKVRHVPIGQAVQKLGGFFWLHVNSAVTHLGGLVVSKRTDELHLWTTTTA